MSGDVVYLRWELANEYRSEGADIETSSSARALTDDGTCVVELEKVGPWKVHRPGEPLAYGYHRGPYFAFLDDFLPWLSQRDGVRYVEREVAR